MGDSKKSFLYGIHTTNGLVGQAKSKRTALDCLGMECHVAAHISHPEGPFSKGTLFNYLLLLNKNTTPKKSDSGAEFT